MKMNNNIRAAKDGKVLKIDVKAITCRITP